ncbi:MAG TPA: hypothetical protein VNR86_05790 [Sphingomicrobium sp.]|nr:hypothetical protein [Sphingomicrobium sp.]
MAELASDPDVRRRHEELARLHAGRAALTGWAIVRTGKRDPGARPYGVERTSYLNAATWESRP